MQEKDANFVTSQLLFKRDTIFVLSVPPWKLTYLLTHITYLLAYSLEYVLAYLINYWLSNALT